MNETLGWILIAAWIVTTLLSIGYYTLGDNPLPYRPLWFRLGSAAIKFAALWLAIRVVG